MTRKKLTTAFSRKLRENGSTLTRRVLVEKAVLIYVEVLHGDASFSFGVLHDRIWVYRSSKRLYSIANTPLNSERMNKLTGYLIPKKHCKVIPNTFESWH
jgi:hypothetical protein